MAQLSSFFALLAAAGGLHLSSAQTVTTVTLGMDIDYPPYAFQTPDGELAGFGKDISEGMTALCPDLEIVVVQGCGALGPSAADGTLDGCLTYTHTMGVRDDLADFSDAILDDNKAAGLLTLLDDNGRPNVSGMDDLAGRTIIDVGGWAPTADGLGYVTNHCLDESYSSNMTVVVADGDVANDEAMRMLRAGEGDAIFIYADQADEYSQCPEGSAWNCTLWEGFGTEYAYVQTGQFGYAVNGTTLSLSRKGSGIREVLGPCMAQFLATEEYYDVCVKHDLVSECYANEFFPDDADLASEIYNLPTDEQAEDCSNGYCHCNAGHDMGNAGDGPFSGEHTTTRIGLCTIVTSLPL